MAPLPLPAHVAWGLPAVYWSQRRAAPCIATLAVDHRCMNQTQPPRPKIAALLVAAIALLTLVTVGRISGHGLWVTEVLDAAHGPVFAALTPIAMAVLRRRGRPRASVVL